MRPSILTLSFVGLALVGVTPAVASPPSITLSGYGSCCDSPDGSHYDVVEPDATLTKGHASGTLATQGRYGL